MQLLERVLWLELHHVLLRDARRQARQTYRFARLLSFLDALGPCTQNEEATTATTTV